MDFESRRLGGYSFTGANAMKLFKDLVVGGYVEVKPHPRNKDVDTYTAQVFMDVESDWQAEDSRAFVHVQRSQRQEKAIA